MDRQELLEEISGSIPPSYNDIMDQNDPAVKLSRRLPHAVVRGHLHFLIGLPRSGKSTWATNWMRQDSRKHYDAEPRFVFPRAVVCADNIRLAVTGQRFNWKAEPTVHVVKNYMIEALLSRGHDVLVDGTHTQAGSIKKNFEIDPNASWTLINTPADVCKERALACGQPDLVRSIDRMAKQLAKLQDEGISQVCERLQREVREYAKCSE